MYSNRCFAAAGVEAILLLLQAKRSDALRVFIMHHYGGLFLDLDVECYRAADDSFQQYDVVLQGTGDEGINNAVMASMPGKAQLHTVLPCKGSNMQTERDCDLQATNCGRHTPRCWRKGRRRG